MMKKNLTESEAYRHLRESAMRQNKTMAELSKSVIDVFQMIE